MDGEADAQALKLGRHGAGIGIAGLDAIGDKDHRGALFRELQGFRRLTDGLRHRCLALGREAVDCCRITGRVERSRFDQGLDVAAGAFLAVPIGHETQLIPVMPFANDAPDDILGDLHLGGAADLPPHRTGGVEHQDDALAIGQGRTSHPSYKQSKNDTPQDRCHVNTTSKPASTS